MTLILTRDCDGRDEARERRGCLRLCSKAAHLAQHLLQVRELRDAVRRLRARRLPAPVRFFLAARLHAHRHADLRLMLVVDDLHTHREIAFDEDLVADRKSVV